MVLSTPRQRRNVLLACCAVGAGGYLTYRIYTSPSVTRKRRQLYRFFSSLSSLLEAAAQGGDCAGLLWKDLNAFLLSDHDEVPQSLKQLLKVGHTREFQISLALLCRSVTQGVVSSLSGSGRAISEESEFRPVLSEELSFGRQALRKAGKARSLPESGDSGYREGIDERLSWKENRARLTGDTDASQFLYAFEDGDAKLESCGDSKANKGNHLERSDSVLRIDGQEVDLDKEDVEPGRYGIWPVSKIYSTGSSMADVARDGVKGKRRSSTERSGRSDGKAEGLPERLVGKLFSEAGRGFASAVVASAARSLVFSLLEATQDRNHKGRNVPDNGVGEHWRTAEEKESHDKGIFKDSFTGDTVKRRTATSASGGRFPEGLIDFISTSKGKSFIADCIESFVGTAVSVYLERTRDVNFYEEMISSVVKPTHRTPVKEILTSVCNGAVETFIRTSHEMMSMGPAGPPKSEPELYVHGLNSALSAPEKLALSTENTCSLSEQGHSEEEGEDPAHGRNEICDDISFPLPCASSPEDCEGRRFARPGTKSSESSLDPTSLRFDSDKVEDVVLLPCRDCQVNGKAIERSEKSSVGSQNWVDGLSRTLAVPSNRALVLDVAGTMTSEAVRSALEVVSSKVSHTFRGKCKEAQKEGKSSPSTVVKIVTKTGELAKATANRAMVIMTMCLAICLHTLLGPVRVTEPS